MTRPKKADRPFCKVRVLTDEGQPSYTSIEWPDVGKERVSSRITKALRHEGYDTKAARMTLAEGRVCFVMTTAPVEIVRDIVGRLFLEVKNEPPKSTREAYMDAMRHMEEGGENA